MPETSSINGTIKGTVLDSINQIHRIMPDSILFGSIILYFLTQNYAYGIFSLFIFETVMMHKLIAWVFAKSMGEAPLPDVKCRSGFKTTRHDFNRMFSKQYPSYGMFSITAIGIYLGLATKEYSDTFDAMGPDWASRPSIAYGLIAITIVTFMMVRWSSCEKFGELCKAFICAILVGVVFFHINKKLFGKESMNFLGVPSIVTKESQGDPIYVCAAEKSS